MPVGGERYSPGWGIKSNWIDAKELVETMLGTILIVFLILALVGALPRWSHSRDWGYFPTGGVGLILVVILVLVFMGRI